MAVQAPSPIQLHPRLARRFYESVKLEEALVKACERIPEYAGRVSADTETGLERVDKKAFYSFLDKLAHVCDIKKGGDTVSAIVAISEFEGIRYFLGSNARKAPEQEPLESFFRTLLAIPTGADPSQEVTGTPQFLRILEHIVAFNKPRIRFYVKTLYAMTIECLTKLRNIETQQPTALKHVRITLPRLKGLLSDCMHSEATTVEETKARVDLIKAINEIIGSNSFARAINLLCGESRFNPAVDWLQLRHFIVRLQAYHVSAETIVACHSRWPDLFENFSVTIVPSSKPDPNPLRTKSKGDDLKRGNTRSDTVLRALRRFSSDEEKQENWRRETEWLERFEIGKIFDDVCCSDGFRPVVHAEVLVHSAVRGHLAENPEFDYWRQWRYIGSSKPTCRLCKYYFQMVPDDVSVRETHDNLYTKWRLPDCFDDAAAKEREDLLNGIIKFTRRDTLRLIQDKLPRGTRNDSSSHPAVASWLRGGISQQQPMSIPSLSEAFNFVSIRNAEEGKFRSVPSEASRMSRVEIPRSQQRHNNHHIWDDDDGDEEAEGGDGGGVRLSLSYS